MAKIIVSFKTEQEAQAALSHLAEAGVGEVRARVIGGAGAASSGDDSTGTTMLTPELGQINVRPTDDTQVTDLAGRENLITDSSAVVPATGGHPDAFQVMIEVEDHHEARVRELLGRGQG